MSTAPAVLSPVSAPERPQLRPLRAPRQPSRIAEPNGLAAWRVAASATARVEPPSEAQVHRVLSGVRRGSSLATVARSSRLSQAAVLTVVVGVGSRISQANKKGPKAARCLTLAEAVSGAGGGDVVAPGACVVDGDLVVVLAEGWQRTSGHGRDIARAYAAVMLSGDVRDARPVSRWLSTLADEQEVTYAHYAHLYAVACGKMRTFTGLTDDPDVQAAYLRAFDDLADRVAAASTAVTRLCGPLQCPEDVLPLLRTCYWMLPSPRALNTLSRSASGGDAVAGSKLRLALGNLQLLVRNRPATFFPRTLADLDWRQFRTVTAEAGYRPTDITDAARSETDMTDLGTALGAARTQAGIDDSTVGQTQQVGSAGQPCAQQVRQLSLTWCGLDA